MDIRNKRDEIYAALTVALAGFKGMENSRAAREAISETVMRCLRVYVHSQVPPLNIEVSTANRSVQMIVKTRDPHLAAAAANAGLLADPAAIGLERVEGAHGAVWAWPELVLVDEDFS